MKRASKSLTIPKKKKTPALAPSKLQLPLSEVRTGSGASLSEAWQSNGSQGTDMLRAHRELAALGVEVPFSQLLNKVHNKESRRPMPPIEDAGMRWRKEYAPERSADVEGVKRLQRPATAQRFREKERYDGGETEQRRPLTARARLESARGEEVILEGSQDLTFEIEEEVVRSPYRPRPLLRDVRY